MAFCGQSVLERIIYQLLMMIFQTLTTKWYTTHEEKGAAAYTQWSNWVDQISVKEEVTFWTKMKEGETGWNSMK